jgi:acetoin utilization protein AcuC
MVPIVYDESYAAYFFGPEHPFSPIRQEMTLDLLEHLGQRPNVIAPPAAPLSALQSVHDDALIDAVKRASTGRDEDAQVEYGLGTPDVPVFPGMHMAASALCGGTLHAAGMISKGISRMVLQFGGGLHHARRSESSGFCVYNDLSLAIAHFRARGWRVAYVDVDVHHGDGVQAIHETDGEVLTISLHESGRYLYPGTGFVHDLGTKGGRGFKLNVPLEPGTTNASYIESFERVVPHALAWFQPDVLVVQCGADAHFRDPLADLALTTFAFEHIFRQIHDLAQQHAHGRLLATLGGGYDPDPTARIWAMLTIILSGGSLPQKLPTSYLQKWETRLGRGLHRFLHDEVEELDHPGRGAAERQNRSSSKRLMELAPPLWY